jgi:hypothetical protein
MYPDPLTKSVKRVMTITVGHCDMGQRTLGSNQGTKKVRHWGVNFTPRPLSYSRQICQGPPQCGEDQDMNDAA